MIYNRFSVKIIVRIVMIALVGYLFTWSLTKDYLVVTKFTLAVLWVLQIIDLIHYMNKTNRQLNSFLQSLRYRDFVGSPRESGKSFKELNLSYNEIIDEIRNAKLETETKHHYLQNMIENIGVGIISFDNDGNVELINRAALDIFKIDYLKKIQSLDVIKPNISDEIFKLNSNTPKMFTIEREAETMKLSFKRVSFKLRGRDIHLLSIQNIKSELEEEEVEAWQKLIRVLSHEIMNSVTPVKSLTATIINMFEKEGKPRTIEEIDNKTLTNCLDGLHAIENRSKGLLNFVQSYRKLTRLPKPILKKVRVTELFNNILHLMEAEFSETKIPIDVHVNPENLELSCDERLVNQVLINLLDNSVQELAGRNDVQISMSAYLDKNETIIQIKDNGPGIPEEIIDKIFIPFYSTKENGSGVGLSLSKQIMRLHNGSISVHSKPDEETVFTLRF